MSDRSGGRPPEARRTMRQKCARNYRDRRAPVQFAIVELHLEPRELSLAWTTDRTIAELNTEQVPREAPRFSTREMHCRYSASWRSAVSSPRNGHSSRRRPRGVLLGQSDAAGAALLDMVFGLQRSSHHGPAHRCAGNAPGCCGRATTSGWRCGWRGGALSRLRPTRKCSNRGASRATLRAYDTPQIKCRPATSREA